MMEDGTGSWLRPMWSRWWGLLALALLAVLSFGVFFKATYSYQTWTVVDEDQARNSSYASKEGGGHHNQGDDSARGHAGLRFSIVYFTGINPRHPWRELINVQLGELVEWGLADAAESISVVLATPSIDLFDDKGEQLLEGASTLVRSVLHGQRFHVFLHSGNQAEYPGIRRVWDVAWGGGDGEGDDGDAGADHLILYFHGKGIFNEPKAGQVRSNANLALTNAVIRPWRDIVSRFAADDKVNKAGFVAAPLGWVWYNFWWARASYVRQLVRPLLNPRRHYYEDWLGRIRERGSDWQAGEEVEAGDGGFFRRGGNDTLSLCSGNRQHALGFTLTPPEIRVVCTEAQEW